MSRLLEVIGGRETRLAMEQLAYEYTLVEKPPEPSLKEFVDNYW